MPRVEPVPYDEMSEQYRAMIEAGAESGAFTTPVPLQILAYADHPPGSVQLEAHRAADHILVAVSDQGRWRAPTGDGFRGRGISLMRLLTHNIHTRCDHRGTVIHLRLELAP